MNGRPNKLQLAKISVFFENVDLQNGYPPAGQKKSNAQNLT